MSDAASPQRFTERGAECRKTHVAGYTGPICSCGAGLCYATRDESENQRFNPASSAASPSLVGQHGNPRPSDGPKWEVEVIDQAEGEVCLRYVNADTVDPWWITEQAWHVWKKYEADHAA